MSKHIQLSDTKLIDLNTSVVLTLLAGIQSGIFWILNVMLMVMITSVPKERCVMAMSSTMMLNSFALAVRLSRTCNRRMNI